MTLVVQQDERNATAWIWLSGAVDSDDERRLCLEHVLAIDPNNSIARRGLEHLRADKRASSADTTPSPDSDAPSAPEQHEPPAEPREAVPAPDAAPSEEPGKAAKDDSPPRTQNRLFIVVVAALAVMLCVAVAGLGWALNRRLAPSENPWIHPATSNEMPAERPQPPGELRAARTRLNDEMIMLYVPAGELEMGSTDAQPD